MIVPWIHVAKLSQSKKMFNKLVKNKNVQKPVEQKWMQEKAYSNIFLRIYQEVDTKSFDLNRNYV